MSDQEESDQISSPVFTGNRLPDYESNLGSNNTQMILSGEQVKTDSIERKKDPTTLSDWVRQAQSPDDSSRGLGLSKERDLPLFQLKEESSQSNNTSLSRAIVKSSKEIDGTKINLTSASMTFSKEKSSSELMNNRL